MIKLQAVALTDPGRERQVNEDRVWAQVYEASEGEAVGLFIVCDGIGGHLGGECASHWAVETVKRELQKLFFPPDSSTTIHLSKQELESWMHTGQTTRLSQMRKHEDRVKEAIEKANRVVYEYSRQRPERAADAGTTISMALVVGSRTIVANVGDSRTYLLHGDRMRQITKDHSLVATLVESKQIKPEEIFNHPQRNLIFRSLGNKKEVQVDTFVESLKEGDYLLLCSDGLWEMVQDEKVIARTIKESSTLEEAGQKLVEAANNAGGEDNIGLVIVKAT
jgi:serine/threonine protein phosphatase PrpC